MPPPSAVRSDPAPEMSPLSRSVRPPATLTPFSPCSTIGPFHVHIIGVVHARAATLPMSALANSGSFTMSVTSINIEASGRTVVPEDAAPSACAWATWSGPSAIVVMPV
jgi:hypothetical protein